MILRSNARRYGRGTPGAASRRFRSALGTCRSPSVGRAEPAGFRRFVPSSAGSVVRPVASPLRPDRRRDDLGAARPGVDRPRRACRAAARSGALHVARDARCVRVLRDESSSRRRRGRPRQPCSSRRRSRTLGRPARPSTRRTARRSSSLRRALPARGSPRATPFSVSRGRTEPSDCLTRSEQPLRRRSSASVS